MEIEEQLPGATTAPLCTLWITGAPARSAPNLPRPETRRLLPAPIPWLSLLPLGVPPLPTPCQSPYS